MSILDEKLAPIEREAIAHYEALAVPAQWFVGTRDDVTGDIEVVAVGDTFVWSFELVQGRCFPTEARITEDGWSTGIEV